MKKQFINAICLTMLGTFWTMSGAQADQPQSDGENLLYKNSADDVLVYKDSTGAVHEVGSTDLVTNRSYANAAAALAALGAGKLWFNTTTKAIGITQA